MSNLLSSLYLFAVTQADCARQEGFKIFDIPSWHKNLAKVFVPADPAEGTSASCEVVFSQFSDVWLVVLALVEIAMRVAAMVAIGFIIFAGIQYVMSQGEPERIKSAQSTLTNAIVGLVISMLAAVIVSFIAGVFV